VSRKIPAFTSACIVETIRLSKLMSVRGLCSRREADVYIERGWVKVDGLLVNELGSKVSPDSAE
jgi:23S rRNA pseudouridine2604 synthase